MNRAIKPRASRARISILFALMCLAPKFSLAQIPTPPVEEMLKRPGVRLVAVEFWAEWCEPCKKAVPLWRRLHETYYDRGLRLVVVTIKSGGPCGYPGWSPDLTICDGSGQLAARWAVSELPQAFLWSWQGGLLAQRVGVDEIETAIVEYFERNLRIYVEADESHAVPEQDPRWLRDMIRGELRKRAKFELVADEVEQQELQRLRKESHGLKYKANERCKLGEEIPANTVLQPDVTNEKLTLKLISLETGCLLGQGSSDFPKGEPMVWAGAISKAVDSLLDDYGTFQEPSTADVEVGEVLPTEEAVLVVEGEPTGATVEVNGPDGDLGAKGLPAKYIDLAPGGYNITVSHPGHRTKTIGVLCKSGRQEKVQVKLARWSEVRERILTVITIPEGGMVSVDGESPKQASPSTTFIVAEGTHLVEVMTPNHVKWAKQIEVKGQTTIKAETTPDYGSLQVRSLPEDAEVFLDGSPVGTTPLDVNIIKAGTHVVVLRKKNHREVILRNLLVKRGQIVRRDEVLPPIMGVLKVRALTRSGLHQKATVKLDGKKVGTTPYQTQTIIGAHRVELIGDEGRWKGRVHVQEDEETIIDGVLVNRPLVRLTTAFSIGFIGYKDGAARTNVLSEITIGTKIRKLFVELGGKTFLEAPHNFILQPGVGYEFLKYMFVRAGIPLVLTNGFDWGGFLGAGARYEWFPFAVFGELSATVLSGSGFAEIPFEARFGMEVVF